MSEYSDVAPEVVERLRPICLALPEAHEERSWTGVRWRIRQRTFAHVICVEPDAPPALARAGGRPDQAVTVVTFRSTGEELHALCNAGHPYFHAGWGRDVVGIVLDAATDWGEVTELLTDSYCLLAPKKLAARVPRPATDDPVAG
ncbi:MAG TPA: MmcQ/YjbR family DNA-binding protein [Acidimicrobiales bacterium]